MLSENVDRMLSSEEGQVCKRVVAIRLHSIASYGMSTSFEDVSDNGES